MDTRIDIAHTNPAAIALMIGTEAITYGQLDAAIATKMAVVQQFTPRVWLLPMHRDLATVAWVYACIRTGRVFVPVAADTDTVACQRLAAHFDQVVVLQAGHPVVLPGQAATVDLPDDSLFIGFTSGTTGVPKGYLRNHASWLASFAAYQQLGVGDNDVACLTPLQYSLGLYALLQTLFGGQTFWLTPRHLADLPERRMAVFAVPSYLREQLQQSRIDPRPLTLLLSGEIVAPQLAEAFARRYPHGQLISFYGASETSFVAYQKGVPNASSLGQTFCGPRLEVRQPDEQGVGELVVAGPLVFQGYFAHGRLTPPQAWVATGDLVRLTAGELQYFGRRDDRINRGGEKLFAAQVQATLLAHPAVADVWISGCPDAILGEAVVATVVWRQQPLTKAALNAYLRQHGRRKAKIDVVHTVAALPLAASGKHRRVSS
ncbi:MAG: long-chain fatty acid--CoA ligase [Lactobacillus sp.]|nr:long-chain fatty acid--CoA ligase [Lactobacillus sp.]